MPQGVFINASGEIVDVEASTNEELLRNNNSRPNSIREYLTNLRTPDCLKTSFPHYSIYSMISFIVVVQIIIYFWSSLFMSPRGWVAPSNEVLDWWGSSNVWKERCVLFSISGMIQLRRLFVPIFLHLSIPHIFLNIIFELSLGAELESILEFSKLRFLFFFLFIGLCGNLLGSAFSESGVGASISCYGLIGADFLLYYFKWPRMSDSEQLRVKNHLTVFAGTLILWELLLWNAIGHFGHLGGFIGGLMGLCLFVPSQFFEYHRETFSFTRFETVYKYSIFSVIVFLSFTSFMIWGRLLVNKDLWNIADMFCLDIAF